MAAAVIDDLTYVGLEKRAHGRVRDGDLTIIGRMRAHFSAFETAIQKSVSLQSIFKKFKELEGNLTERLSFEYFKLCLYRIRHPENNKAYTTRKPKENTGIVEKKVEQKTVATPVSASPVVKPSVSSVAAPVVSEDAEKKSIDDGDFPDPVLTPEQIAQGFTPWHFMTPRQKAARRKKEEEERDRLFDNRIDPLLMRVLNKQQEKK